ncbi:cytochrome P450 [Melanogaster broomeanus]|nr:cytochrome P450 [Melanogaster broomeanus]
MSSITLDIISQTGIDVLNKFLARTRSVRVLGAAALALWASVELMRITRRRLRTTRLKGPPSSSWVYGVGKQLKEADDPGAMYEAWAKEYGPVYEVPSTLGGTRIVLCDPKAMAHFYAKETWTYIQIPAHKAATEALFGRGLISSQGESHRRQRNSLSPALSNIAIRRLSSIFYDSAYKMKVAWDALMVSGDGDGVVIDVQSWMNYVSLDIIGLAGFSHDFGSLDGKPALVTEVLDSFGASPSSALRVTLFLLAEKFPILLKMPTAHIQSVIRLNHAMEEITNALLDRTRKEIEAGVTGDKEDQSIIGRLIKGTSADSEYHLSQDEILAQLKVVLLAGYETTSISLTWALVELARNPDIQTRLRNELFQHGTDPTYDELSNGLPYLDAVVHETLRVHPPIHEFTRVAIEDDVIPLSEPIRTKSGKLVDSISIAEGTLVAISMQCINRSAALWGADAKVFNPSRWLEDEHSQNGIPAKAKEVQGHRHLLTFVDGPRMCLGKGFAVVEFKIVLAILIKNFVFEMCDGPEAEIVMGNGVLPRPKLAGEVGSKMPLRVRHLDS